MSLPSDITLPANAKYLGFVDYVNDFNSNYDITWSFTYALTGVEHGIVTFLTNQPEVSGYPGHYMGYTGTIPLTSYLSSEDGSLVLDEEGSRILIEESPTGVDFAGCLAIAFDSSGYFGLSSTYRDGVTLSDIKKDVLAIRDGNNSLVLYEQLSNITPDFIFYDDTFNFQTLRFRYANSGRKISIDYRDETEIKFHTLTSINLNLDTYSYGNLNVGFSYCSPISSSSDNISTLKIKNFQVQGVNSDPTYEILVPDPITN